MLSYLLSGIEPTGKRNTIRIHAATAQEAWSHMETLRYTEIVLHTDDAAAAATEKMPTPEENGFSPQEAVQLQCISNWGLFVFAVKKLYRVLWWLPLMATVMPVYLWLSGATAGLPGALGMLAMVLALPVIFAAMSVFVGARHKFNALLEASCWGRWQEVLDRVPALRGKVPDFELDMRTATALAGLGRLEEGLAVIEPYADSVETPEWMHCARLADVYEVAGRYEDVLECHRRAYAIAPENPTVAIDLAMALLNAEEEANYADELIAYAETQPMSDILQVFIPYVKGLAALNINNSSEAIRLFDVAEEPLVKLAAGSPPIQLTLVCLRAYRAIAHAKIGERAKAEALFAEARPRLEALGDSRVIARYEQAIHG